MVRCEISNNFCIHYDNLECNQCDSLVRWSILDMNMRQTLNPWIVWNWLRGKERENWTYVILHTMLHEHWVILIIVPCFSCPFSTRWLYITGRSSSCLWMPSEIEIRNQIDDELTEVSWFKAQIYTSGERLTAPCSNSETESSVTIVSIM